MAWNIFEDFVLLTHSPVNVVASRALHSPHPPPLFSL
jgi:hypothetical protein